MARPKTEAADYYPTMVRLPQDIRQALVDLAHAGHRAINTQMILVLREALHLPDPRANASQHTLR